VVWKVLTGGGAHPCGRRAFDTARIEAGFPIYGRDISERNLPQEVARDELALSFVKGCYIGQETVARIDALGHVNRLLRGIKLHSDHVPADGTELRAAGQTIGEITSATCSPLLAAPMALAYIRRGYDQPGTRLECEHGAAEVVRLPVERAAAHG
jgi:folate-binding protein YgfZ